MSVIDASAILCFLLDEPGADVVEAALTSESWCSAVNWSEVAQKTAARGMNWSATRELLLSQGMRVEPVGIADAEAAAQIWRESPSLSLADRTCLALGRRLGETVLTADRAWGEGDGIMQVRASPGS